MLWARRGKLQDAHDLAVETLKGEERSAGAMLALRSSLLHGGLA